MARTIRELTERFFRAGVGSDVFGLGPSLAFVPNRWGTCSEPIPHRFRTGSELSPQMEDGGKGRRNVGYADSFLFLICSYRSV